MALTAKITTTPIFSLASDNSAINRTCKVSCAEPKIVVPSNPSNYAPTWFSGFYEIFGFKHIITNNSAESQFFISRGTGSANYADRLSAPPKEDGDL